MAEESNHYGATAARAHGKPGRETRPKSLTVDCHAHVFIPEVNPLVAGKIDPMTIPLARFATPETQALNRKQDADRTQVTIDHDLRVAELDAMGVDMQLVAPAPNQCFTTVAPEVAVPAARVVNDGIAAFCAKRADRFIPLGTVPFQVPDAAVAELERVMGMGFKGVQILTQVNGREISSPEFEPFWAAAERLGALVMLHPVGFTGGERFSRFYFSNVIGNPLDTTVALHYLIFDGVLERYPALKVLAVHGGGFLPSYAGRIDHAWGARTDCRGSLPNPPTHYLRKVWFDTIVFTPHQLEYLVRLYGADRILMGTDFPYDMADSDPVGHVCSVESFDEATRAAICGGNAQRLLGL